MRIALQHEDHRFSVEVHAEGTGYRVALDGDQRVVEAHYGDAGTLVLSVDGRRYRVDLARLGNDRLIAIAGEVYRFVPQGSAQSHSVATVAAPEIIAPMPGKVLQVLVKPGDDVAAGDALVILEAMKMETRLFAEAAGTVTDVRVAAGDMVNGRQVLLVLAYETGSTPL